MEQDLYGFSTELDADERGCGGLAQMIRVNLPNPLDSRSILRLQKNGSDAEMKKIAPIQTEQQKMAAMQFALLLPAKKIAPIQCAVQIAVRRRVIR